MLPCLALHYSNIKELVDACKTQKRAKQEGTLNSLLSGNFKNYDRKPFFVKYFSHNYL